MEFLQGFGENLEEMGGKLSFRVDLEGKLRSHWVYNGILKGMGGKNVVFGSYNHGVLI